MANKIYSDSIEISTDFITLNLDESTGRLSCIYPASMSSINYTVASYSTTISMSPVSIDNNCIITQGSPRTLTLPSSVPDGYFLIIRKTDNIAGTVPDQTSTIITTLGTPNSILPVFTLNTSGVIGINSNANGGTYSSISMQPYGSFMFVFYQGIWYGI